MKPVWETVAGRVGQAFVGLVEVEVEVVVEVVVIVRAGFGVEREVVRVFSRREMWVVVTFEVEVAPGQIGSVVVVVVGRGAMWGLR